LSDDAQTTKVSISINAANIKLRTTIFSLFMEYIFANGLPSNREKRNLKIFL